MYIMDGYSFRNTIAIIKSEIENATMIISPQSIEISLMNTSKCGVHRILLNPKEFSLYKYNIRDEQGQLVPSYPIAFNTNDMFITTKGIGRKDGIKIYWLAGENRISVQPIKTSSSKNPGQASALFVAIIPMEHKRFEIGTYDPNPNVKVAAKDFADICSQANALKCISIELSCKATSVVIKPIKANKKIAAIYCFDSQMDFSTMDNEKIVDDQDESEDPEISNVHIPILTAKALSKIHNLSLLSNGTQLRFYFRKNQAIKIETPISNYGTYTICIR
jgi:hypothetical protein